MSPKFKGPLDAPSRWLQIDAWAGTQLIGFDGDLAKIDFLRWDLPNFVHHLRRNARIAIVAPGGGRDVLTAKRFGQQRPLSAETDAYIMHVANERFGDFTGHSLRGTRVTLAD